MIKKSYPCIIFLMICIIMLVYTPAIAKGQDLLIVIDPGHGGDQTGATAFDGETLEKDVNLKISRFLKKELENYGAKVIMTREDDTDVDLDLRSEIAEDVKADLLVSIHNNAYGGDSQFDHGAFVLASKGSYRKKLADEEQKLACNILYELSQIGIYDQGILLRESEVDDLYPNGEKADYYRIVKAGIKNNRKQIIIEHAYLDNEDDYKQFFSTDSALKKLAKADARGIARYYGLKNKKSGKALDKLESLYETLVLFVEKGDPEISRKIFYLKEIDNFFSLYFNAN